MKEHTYPDASEPGAMRHGHGPAARTAHASKVKQSPYPPLFHGLSRIHRVQGLAGPACGSSLEDREGVLEVLVRLLSKVRLEVSLQGKAIQGVSGRPASLGLLSPGVC